MAITDLGLLGSGSSTTSGTTLAVTASAAIPAGTLLVLALTFDNHASATAATLSLSDSGGGAWVQRGSTRGSGATSTAGTGVWGAVFTTLTTSAISSGATITTVTFSSAVVSKVARVEGFSGVQHLLRGTVASAASTAGTPSALTTGTALEAGDLVIGTIHGETNQTPTGDTDTLNGSWSTLVGGATTGGGAATNTAVGIQYKVVTATGVQTYNATTANDSAAFVFALQPVLSGTGDLTGSGTLTATGTPLTIASAGLTGDGTLAATGTALATDPVLLGEWGFLDNLDDTSGNGHTATASGYTPTYVTGPQTNTRAIQFTGAAQTVSYGRTGLEPAAGTGGVTFMAWVNLGSGAPNASQYYGVVHHDRDAASASTRAGIDLFADKFRPLARWRDQLVFVDGLGSDLHTAGGWHHLCVVDGEDRYEFYLDGVSLQTAARTNHTTAVTWEDYPWVSGHQPGDSQVESYSGLCVSGVRIFAGQLSTTEVNTWMNTAITAGTSSFTGSGSLSGSGTLTATTTVPSTSASVDLSGSGTTSASTVPTPSTSLTLAGLGTLSAAGTPTATASLSLSGSGTATTQSTPSLAASAGLTGSGTAVTQGKPDLATSVNLTGAGTGIGLGTPSLMAQAGVSGTGTLDGTATTGATADFTGTGILSAQGTPTATTSRALAGSGTTTAAAHPALSSQQDLVGDGSLTASTASQWTGSGDLAGAGTLAASGQVVRVIVSAQCASTGGLTASGLVRFAISTECTSTGALVASEERAQVVTSVAHGGTGLLEARIPGVTDRNVTATATVRRTWAGDAHATTRHASPRARTRAGDLPTRTWRADASARRWAGRGRT